MCRASSVAVVVWVVVASSAIATDWKVGEKWTYQHEGPRPYADPSAKVQGDRIVEVTAIEGEDAERRTLLKSLWGTADGNPAVLHIDAKNLIHKIDIQAMGVLRFDPPIPALWSLKVGEQKIVKTKVDVGGFAMTIQYVAKRLDDETVTVPAGRFEKCQHVTIVSTTESDFAPSTKNKMDYWYHPSVKNSVKEVIITNFDSDNSYSATSTLKAFSVAK